MPEAPRHEFSSVTIGGAARALQELGWTAAVMERASPVTAEALKRPGALAWHDGAVLGEVVSLVAELGGAPGAETFMAHVVKHSVSRVLAPLARVVLALASNNPGALLERVDALIRGVSRGLHGSYLAEGERSGVVTIRYPHPVPRAVAWGWKGALVYLLEFCGVRGEVEVLPDDDDGAAVRLGVSWRT